MNENLQMIFGGIIIMVGFGAAIAYPRLQYSALRQMRGVWLVLSLVPLAVMLVVGVVTALALSEGANLWPLLLIFTAPVATAYLAVLRFVERRATRRDPYPRCVREVPAAAPSDPCVLLIRTQSNFSSTKIHPVKTLRTLGAMGHPPTRI